MLVVYLYDRAGAALGGAADAGAVSVGDGDEEQLTPATHRMVKAVSTKGRRIVPPVSLDSLHGWRLPCPVSDWLPRHIESQRHFERPLFRSWQPVACLVRARRFMLDIDGERAIGIVMQIAAIAE